MRTTCCCGAEWTGLRIEHCAECHETFTGTSAGDRHRVGEHHLSTGPDRRRCLSPDEMRAKGMEQNARGQWTNGGTSPWAKQRAEQNLLAAAQDLAESVGLSKDQARVWIGPAGSHPLGVSSEGDMLAATKDGVEPMTEVTTATDWRLS